MKPGRPNRGCWCSIPVSPPKRPVCRKEGSSIHRILEKSADQFKLKAGQLNAQSLLTSPFSPCIGRWTAPQRSLELVNVMSELTKEKFIHNVRRSRLVSDVQLKDFIRKIRDLDPRPKTATDLSELMVADELINRWHAENILRGKYKGFTLGKYRLLGHLGTGGMSSVFLAEHPVMKRLVAIKVLPQKYVENPNYLDRFKREARAVAALDHPNIVRAYDIDQDDSRHYIVMEHVDGRDLQRASSKRVGRSTKSWWPILSLRQQPACNMRTSRD